MLGPAHVSESHENATPQQQPQAETIADHATAHPDNAPPTDPRENVLHIQRTQGNAAARRWVEGRVSHVQRDDPPATAVAQTWRAPTVFDDVTSTARTKSEAGMIVLLMTDRLATCRRRLEEIHEAANLLSDTEHASVRLIQNITRDAEAHPDLTPDDVNQLNIWAGFARNAYEGGLNRLAARAQADVQPLQQAPDTADLDARAEQIQEELHRKFMDGTADSSVSQLRQGLDAINEYKEQADRFVTWGRRIAGWMRWTRASEFLTRAGGALSSAGEGLDTLRSIASAADNLQTLFGGRAAGGNGIAEFRSALNLIDAADPLIKAVPGLNILWSGYYAPMTRQIINALSHIFALQDLQVRQMTLIDWMREPRADGVAPTIPRHLMSVFPGGQPVLNFMYALMNGGEASVNTAVEDFFTSHESLFNAAHEEERDQLQTESTAHWYNPFSWVGSRRVAPNLMQWVRDHRATVWAQLYGSLPHNLR
ncbi:MAG: hypothetical protein K8L91_12340 [Anaerolineae bacterium]|nr:hypothetical protein [Anaerolineae bacterium]